MEQTLGGSYFKTAIQPYSFNNRIENFIIFFKFLYDYKIHRYTSKCAEYFVGLFKNVTDYIIDAVLLMKLKQSKYT